EIKSPRAVTVHPCHASNLRRRSGHKPQHYPHDREERRRRQQIVAHALSLCIGFRLNGLCEYHARIYVPLAVPRFSLRQKLCTVAAQRVFLPLTATLRRSRCRGFALYTPNRTGSWHSSEGRTHKTEVRYGTSLDM